MPKADFEAFLSHFLEEKLPLDLSRDGTFILGDRLPSRFNPWLKGRANDYRAGSMVTLPSTLKLLTLAHLGTARVILQIYSADGKPLVQRTVTAFEGSNGALVGQEDLTGISTRYAKTIETRIDAKEVLQTIQSEATESTYYVKRHIDGTRPISKISCQTSGVKSRDELTAGGQFKRLDAEVLPTRSTTDEKGCPDTWPLVDL